MRLEDMIGSQEWKMRLRDQAYKGKFPQQSKALNSTYSKLGHLDAAMLVSLGLRTLYQKRKSYLYKS